MHFATRAALAATMMLSLAACGDDDKGVDSDAADTVAPAAAVPAPATVTDSMGVTGGVPAPMDSTMKHDSTTKH
jgi:hypothetical protein